MGGWPVGYLHNAVEELTSGLPRTYSDSSRVEDLIKGPPDNQLSKQLGHAACLNGFTLCGPEKFSGLSRNELTAGLIMFLGETLTLKCLSPAKIVNGFRWTVMITKIANRQVNLCSWVPVFEKGFTFHLTVSVIMLTRTSHPVSISCSDFADHILRWHRVQLYPIPGRSTGNLIYYSLIFYKVRIL